MGFVTHQYLQTIIDKRAYFINRMPPKWSVLQKETCKQINWKSIYSKIRKYDLKHMEMEVMIGKENKSIASRLVVSVVPLSVYQERIRKVQKPARSKGTQVSEKEKLNSLECSLIYL